VTIRLARERRRRVRRRVGLFTYSTLPRGSVVHTAHLADALVDAGWEVTVHALDKDGRGFFRSLSSNLRLVPAAPPPDSTAELVRLRAEELARYLVEDDQTHDIHHAQDCLSTSGLLAARARGLAMRLVRTVHHVERFDDPTLDDCQTRSIRRADLCLSVSQAARRDVRGTFGIESVVVGNGVDLARFRDVDPERLSSWKARLGSAAPLVLAMGGVEPRKNTLGTLQAFARLHLAHPRAQLWIVGGATVLDHGTYRRAFDDARARLPEPTRSAISELGVVAEPDVPALFRLAHVLAMPSLHEGFGLCALEALAAGLPVVASNQSPFTEFLDPSCATLVDPASPGDIAAGLACAVAVAASPERRAAGLACAVRHSWARVAERHLDQYERTLAHARDALHGSLA